MAARDNTLERNTTDRNLAGIHVSDGSYGNLVRRNLASANGSEGIRLLVGATENTVQDNTIAGSFLGIWLAFGDVSGNIVQGNNVTLNVLGIWLELGATGNSIQDNTALDNGDWDLGDQNPGCDSNTWAGNEFNTDNVAGLSDGGPATGCIQ
jgi:parallel beta-helix repeat protein